MQAIRSVFMQRGFAAAAIFTLALGIAASTAIFSVVHGVLLRPLPYAEADRLVRLSEFHPGANAPFRGERLSNLTYFAWNGQAKTIGPIATFGGGQFTVGDIAPVRMTGAPVSPELFDVLRVQPALGRFFVPDDVADGAAPVVVLSDGLWRERYGSNPQAIGQTLMIDHKPHRIVGVAPPGFAFPSVETRFWTPTRMSRPGPPDQPTVGITNAIARLSPDVTPEQAAAEGTAAARSVTRPMVADLMFGKGGPVEVRVQRLVDQMTGTIRPALLVLAGAVVALLLIACVNVANLLLSRGVAREREIAVRVAIGASRSQITSYLLAESLVIAVAAGVLGVAGAWAIIRVLPSVAPADLPRLADIRVDGWSVLFATAAVLASAVLAGVVPALRAATPDLLPALRESAGASSSRRTARLRQMMLAAEAALAVMLLIGSGLLIRSFVRLINVDPGYDASNVLTADIYLPPALGEAETTAFLGEFLPRVRALPGVTAAGVSNMMPLGSSTSIAGFTLPIPGREPVAARAIVYVGTPGYAESLRLKLLAGRLLDERDVTSPVQAMVVNEEFVRTFLDGVEPIGLQFQSVMAKGTNTEIVGVVGNVLKDGLDAKPQPEIYVALAHDYSLRNNISFVMRTAGDPTQYAEMVRDILRDLRPDAAIDRVGPLATRIDASVAQPRFAAWVLALFALLAMMLSSIGLYSVLAYTVARRQRELGVRTALGASRGRIVSLICREGLGIATVGLALGVATAAGLSRWLESMLFGIDAHDTLTFVLAPALLFIVAAFACLVPAMRAAATNPTIALKAE